MADDKTTLDSDVVEKLIEKLSEKTEKSGGGLKTAIITCVASIVGGLIVGGSNLLIERFKEKGEQTIERQKFDAELIKLALAPATSDDRLTFLNFMVKTNLIADPKVKQGVGEYVEKTKTNKGEVPRYIGALSSVNQPEDVKTLLDQYQTIRATEPSGGERTFEMTVIMNKLIALMNDVKELPVEMLFKSTDERDHLGVVAYLYGKPDAGKLDALIDATLKEDQPFIQYWGIQTIGKMVRAKLNGDHPPEVSAATQKSLDELLKKVEPSGDPSRVDELKRIISSIPKG